MDPAVAQNPKAEAADVLSAYWAGEGYPVDPYSIARQLGIDVYTAHLPEDVSGMLVKREGDAPAIYLNGADAEVRQRFTCAHELGHYMRHVGDGTHDLSFVDKRDPLATRGTDPEETFANGFAANLLMPEPAVREQHDYGFSDIQLAEHFRVSLASMKNRLATLKLS